LSIHRPIHAQHGTDTFRLQSQRYHKTHDVQEVAPIFRKAYARKGFALMGLQRYRLAKTEFEHGLRMGPDCPECKRGLEQAVRSIAKVRIGPFPNSNTVSSPVRDCLHALRP
jgi:hypothetical protein